MSAGRHALLGLTAGLLADPTGVRAEPWSFEGGVTGVSLHPDGGTKDDQTLSADLFARRATARGEWLVYVEGNSGLDAEAASSVFVEANADAGTALNPDRDGRVQLSELNFRFSYENGSGLTVGLLDASGYLDRTRITNDENLQFLGASFVNNPTIEFPDYTIGVVYERPQNQRAPQINVVLTSASGLADNPSFSYRQVLRLTDEDDGAFAAVGLGWIDDRRLLRVGTWINTRPHVALSDDTDDDDTNYGAYFVLGRSWGEHAMNMRLGLANSAVTEGARFTAIAYRYRWREHVMGLGLARTFLSTDAETFARDDSTQAEVFARFNLTSQTHVTLSLQRLHHSSFVDLPGDPRTEERIVGLRLRYGF